MKILCFHILLLVFVGAVSSGSPVCNFEYMTFRPRSILVFTSIKGRTRQAVSTLYRVRSLALQPLSAGNSAEFSQADNSKTVQHREINLTSLDSLGSRASIYIYFKPKNREKYELNHFQDNRNTILDLFW